MCAASITPHPYEFELLFASSGIYAGKRPGVTLHFECTESHRRAYAIYNMQRSKNGKDKVAPHSILGSLFRLWGVHSNPSRFMRTLKKLNGRHFLATIKERPHTGDMELHKNSLRLLTENPCNFEQMLAEVSKTGQIWADGVLPDALEYRPAAAIEPSEGGGEVRLKDTGRGLGGEGSGLEAQGHPSATSTQLIVSDDMPDDFGDSL